MRLFLNFVQHVPNFLFSTKIRDVFRTLPNIILSTLLKTRGEGAAN